MISKKNELYFNCQGGRRSKADGDAGVLSGGWIRKDLKSTWQELGKCKEKAEAEQQKCHEDENEI